jgi:hypothetical protein
MGTTTVLNPDSPPEGPFVLMAVVLSAICLYTSKSQSIRLGLPVVVYVYDADPAGEMANDRKRLMLLIGRLLLPVKMLKFTQLMRISFAIALAKIPDTYVFGMMSVVTILVQKDGIPRWHWRTAALN